MFLIPLLGGNFQRENVFTHNWTVFVIPEVRKKLFIKSKYVIKKIRS